jgi:hypothetical protein
MMRLRGLELVGLEGELSVLTPTPVYDGRLDMLGEKGFEYVVVEWFPDCALCFCSRLFH